MEGVTFSENPVPNFTAIKEQYPSGVLYIPVIGAGTVNTEFEILTGMNVNHFGAGEYPYRSILIKKTCETVAYDLLASGYRTHAIHNHEGSFYLRNDVYKNMGFETFTSIEYFQNPTFNENDWAHDALLTDEILYILDSTEESDFIFTVSAFSDLFTMLRDSNRKEWFKNYPKSMPTLIMSGGADPVGNYGKGPMYVYKQLLMSKCENLQIKMYEGARHELFKETNRQDVFADLTEWLNGNIHNLF
jgi:phosphoglycerol transferase MdoB-like AlkP superfamily enzyme